MAGNYDISIIQGSSLSLRVVATNSDGSAINLSGYSARGRVKYQYSDVNCLLDLNPQIDPSFVSGLVNINLDQTQTTGLPVIQGVYDLEVYTSGQAVKFLWGKANIYPQVLC